VNKRLAFHKADERRPDVNAYKHITAYPDYPNWTSVMGLADELTIGKRFALLHHVPETHKTTIKRWSLHKPLINL
jgi:hypothetical protein